MYAHLTSFRRENQLASLTASLTTKFRTPTVDKITLLADLRHYERNLHTIQGHIDYLDWVPCYDRHYDKILRTASDLRITLACPVSAPVPHLRIEFNPNKFNPTDTLWHTLYPMLKNKRITRLDYAIDYDEDLSLYSWDTDRSRSGNYFFGQDKSLETLYLGKRSSPNQYRIYDKVKEQETHGVYLASPHWRIEQQFKLDKSTEFWMLHPFEDLIGWRPDTFTGNYKDDLILHDLHATPNNWKRLSRHDRIKYRRLIKDHTRVQHFPIKPVTTFQSGYPELKAFLEELLT